MYKIEFRGKNGGEIFEKLDVDKKTKLRRMRGHDYVERIDLT